MAKEDFEKKLLKVIAENPNKSYKSLSEILGLETHHRVRNWINKLEKRGLVKTVEEKRYNSTLSSLTLKGIAYTIRLLPELENNFWDLILNHTTKGYSFIIDSFSIIRNKDTIIFRDLIIQPFLDELNYLDLDRIDEDELQ